MSALHLIQTYCLPSLLYSCETWNLSSRDEKSLCRTMLLCKKMLRSGNLIMCRLAKCCDASVFALAVKFHIEPHNVVRSSVARIKNCFWFYFSKLVWCVLCLFVSFLCILLVMLHSCILN